MENFSQFIFKFIAFVFFGLSMEVIFSVTGIELALGKKLKKQTPHKYLEGFVSLYMIPIHGFGMTLFYLPFHTMIQNFHLPIRYLIWCAAFTICEIIGAIIYEKALGFYPWDYYKESKFKIFNVFENKKFFCFDCRIGSNIFSLDDFAFGSGDTLFLQSTFLDVTAADEGSPSHGSVDVFFLFGVLLSSSFVPYGFGSFVTVTVLLSDERR